MIGGRLVAVFRVGEPVRVLGYIARAGGSLGVLATGW